MKIDFLTVLIAVFALLIMTIPGFIFGKLKIMPEKSAETCSKIVMYCCQTALAFNIFASKTYTSEIGKNMLIVFGLAVGLHLLMAILLQVFVRSKSDRATIIKNAGYLGNCGFMGIPFLQMLFGNGNNDVLIYAAVIIVVFNLFNWTLGVFTISGDKKQISVKKILLNPVIIAIILGFVLFVTVQKPFVQILPEGTVWHSILEKVLLAIEAFSDMVTPLSMFVIGLRLSTVSLKQLFLDKDAYLVCLIKLILMPMITILVVAFLPVSNMVKYAIFLMLAMPSATSTSLFAVMYDKESNFSTVCVLLTTVLSIITIPVMFLVMSGLFGVVI